MARATLPLTDTQIKTCKSKDKMYRLYDGKGLCLQVETSGSKFWRYKYRYDGKAKMMTLGSYPEVSLKKARQLHKAARLLVTEGINPMEQTQEDAESVKPVIVTFAKIAMEWFGVAKNKWVPGHARTVLSRLERDVLPVLGSMPIADITTPDVLKAIRFIEDRGAIETAHRVKSIIGQVFTYALVIGVEGVTMNPAVGLRQVLRKPKVKHMSAVTDPDILGKLLRDIDAYNGAYVTKCALRLAPMLFVRPGELRAAEWNEIELDEAVWRIPEEKTKTGESLIVPLATQVVQILRDLHLFTGNSRYVFVGRLENSYMSENTLLKALRTMGWDDKTVTTHGFRATARTLLHERLGYNPDAIEAQLGHRVPDRLGGAYNRTKHLEERTRMMQEWADYLFKIKS